MFGFINNESVEEEMANKLLDRMEGQVPLIEKDEDDYNYFVQFYHSLHAKVELKTFYKCKYVLDNDRLNIEWLSESGEVKTYFAQPGKYINLTIKPHEPVVGSEV